MFIFSLVCIFTSYDQYSLLAVPQHSIRIRCPGAAHRYALLMVWPPHFSYCFGSFEVDFAVVRVDRHMHVKLCVSYSAS